MTVDLHVVDGLTPHDNGQVTLSGPLLELERRIDALLLAWAADCGAVEYRFPPLLAARALERIDYFRSFPHLATFPVALSRDDAQVRAFAASPPVGGDGALRLGPLDAVREVLTPAACYPVYAHFQDTRLEAPVYLTTRATCFRRESRYEPLARQWAFSMREIVCLGRREEVVAFLAHYRARVAAFAAALDLPLSFVAATDSFFDPTCHPAHLLQRLAPAKHEMVFGGRLAIGSFNFHRRHFGAAFAITRDGRPVFSACVAFGIERWILALLERFGTHPDHWPDLASVGPGPVARANARGKG